MNSVQTWIRRLNAPITVSIAILLAVGSLFFFFSAGNGMSLIWADGNWTRQPWTLITYPFAYIGVGGIGTLLWSAFMLAWMIYACGSVERELGPPKYIGLWVLFTVLPALLMLIGANLMRGSTILAGPYLPISAFTVAWATRNPRVQFSLWGIIPLTGRILGWVVVAGTFFSYGFGTPVLGVIACLHLGLAHLMAAGRVPFFSWKSLDDERRAKRQEIEEAAFREEVLARKLEREEKEKLRRLFERSGIDDK
jgi:hypothetical protein